MQRRHEHEHADHDHGHAEPEGIEPHEHGGAEEQALLLDRLGDQGLRMTGPRRAIVEALVRRHDAFTADDLLTELPAVGRATVFRTIRLLVESGLVCKLSQIDGRPLYSLAHAGHHHHAVCQGCGAVIDIYRCGVDNLLENIELATGSRVIGHRLEVFVMCPACVAKETAASSN